MFFQESKAPCAFIEFAFFRCLSTYELESLLCLKSFSASVFNDRRETGLMVLRLGLWGVAMLTRLFTPFLFSCHLTVFALTLPSLINVTTERIVPNDDNNAIQNSEAHCTQDRPAESILPLSPDCIVAVRMLPRNDYIGTFHIGGLPNLWRLPHLERYGSCTVSVILDADHDVELGSWDDVFNAAIKVVLGCRSAFEPGGDQRTGGWITGGAENGIMVELRKSRVRGTNGTGGGTSLVDVE